MNTIDKFADFSREELLQHIALLESNLAISEKAQMDLTNQNDNLIKKLMLLEDELAHTKSTLNFYTNKFATCRFAAKTEEEPE